MSNITKVIALTLHSELHIDPCNCLEYCLDSDVSVLIELNEIISKEETHVEKRKQLNELFYDRIQRIIEYKKNNEN